MVKLKEKLLEALRQGGLAGLHGEPWEMAGQVTEPRAALRISRVRAVDGGFGRYLGTDALGRELYGMQLELELALMLLSPKEEGASGAEEYAEKVLTTLILSPVAVAAGEICCGEMGYDPKRDCFRQEMTLKTGALAVAVQEDETMLLTEIRLKTVRD